MALFGALGASVYLYLPLRSVTEPSFNWGHPDTWARFVAHVTDRKDAQYHFRATGVWWPYIEVFGRNLRAELSTIGWIAGLGGLALLLRRRPRLGVFTLLFGLGNAFFFLRIWTIPDAYLPTYFVVALLAGVLLSGLLEARSIALRFASFAAVLGVLVSVALQARDGSIRAGVASMDAARSAAEANLLPLPPNALVFATTNWFPFRYLQDVEGMRPDVTILLQGDLAKPEFFTPVTAKRFPRVLIPTREEARGRSYPFFQALVRKNLGRAPIFWEPMDALTPNVAGYLRPWRYLWRFERGMRPSTSAELQGYRADLEVFLRAELESPVSLDPGAAPNFDSRLLADRQRRIYHAFLLGQSADVLKFQGRTADAIALTMLALHLTPDNPKLSNELGQLYSGLGQWEPAERMFRQAMLFAPKDATPVVNLAILQMSVDRLREARATLARAMQLDPDVPQTYYQLSVLERRSDRREAALRALERAIALSERESERRAWLTELESLRRRAALNPPGGSPEAPSRAGIPAVPAN
jgi:tetratricopeptide (TPR) repeat protein